jgi:uncharacterized FlgJ-related protein
MAKDWCDEKDPTNKKVINFILKYQNDAQEIASLLGIPKEWLMGLSATESAYGTSNIARKAKNFFGQTAGASGNIGFYLTSQGAKVAKFKNFKASAQSFAKDFGSLIKNKRTQKEFIDALVPKFNTADQRTNGNPKFKEDTLAGINSIIKRSACKQLVQSHKCGVKCQNFEKYGSCDRLTKSKNCWQHS